jgi:hypothetical protein
VAERWKWRGVREYPVLCFRTSNSPEFVNDANTVLAYAAELFAPRMKHFWRANHVSTHISSSCKGANPTSVEHQRHPAFK